MNAIIVLAIGCVAAVSTITVLFVLKHRRPEVSTPTDPLRVLQVRVARGEITIDEYHAQRSRLGAAPPPAVYHRRGPTRPEEPGP